MNRHNLTRSIIAQSASSRAPHALTVPNQAVPPAADADAGLLSLCRRYQSMEGRQNLLFDEECKAQEVGDKDLERWLVAVQRRYVPYQHRLMADIVDAKPKTQAGVLAKASVFMAWVPRDLDGSPAGDFGPLWSLCRDVLGYDPGEGAGVVSSAFAPANTGSDASSATQTL
jgi:hypothetical protein